MVSYALFVAGGILTDAQQETHLETTVDYDAMVGEGVHEKWQK